MVRIGKELIGYIEAKDFAKVSNLQGVESTEQVERYQKEFDNFILTNFVEFWLWRKSERKWAKKVKIIQPNIISQIKTLLPAENEKEFFDLLSGFIQFSIPERKTAKLLAVELASRAKRMRQPLLEELNNDIKTDVDRIYNNFKRFLMPDLTEVNFADIYAQTITYGLFVARLQFKGNKKDLHKEGKKDPIVHFYETFLTEYDPKKRKRMGEYYTPVEVVSYIINSINELLKEKFAKKLGFASNNVTLLDFAAGTCTFPAQAIVQAKEEIDNSNQPGNWHSIVKENILKNFYAFEISMASWIIGHLKISLLLEDLGYKFEKDEGFNLYLTNTLDFTRIQGQDGIFTSALSEEAQKAGEVKKEKPILVITGNPPYSVSSSNIIKLGSELYDLYESYKEIVRQEEKNIQPLSDDYIKFIAFAHYKIKQAGKGIIGIITNNSYLNGLIHRDLRRKLTEDFDEIYILNLHDNSS